MCNKLSLFSSSTAIETNKCSLNRFLHMFEEGELFLDAEYQRDYVWCQKDVQNLLFSLFNGFPIGGFSAVINKNETHKYYEVVDGKQRLTSLINFMTNKVPYITCNEAGEHIETYFKDMSKIDQKLFRGINSTENLLINKDGTEVTEKQKAEYFMRINFLGVKQSESHKERILDMIK